MWGDRYMFSLCGIALHTIAGQKFCFMWVGLNSIPISGVWLDYVPITRDFYHHLKDLGYRGSRSCNFALPEGEVHHETRLATATSCLCCLGF